ncbi:hypothetical protein PPACK8108_LOCUS5091 [Phakopsora pachyrhizi]|uniref:Uncharacterized protein n=1 Tax=Phakopsora pachyrhizi TaxID=170000 RepID=A0AAV0ANL7_PHAPC|nr:hypothetical protein PPACK8108_LOCUS5091 [Phakopsora pachyrhizi]
MRSFVSSTLIILFCQLAVSLTIIERSEVGSSNEQLSEKQYPGGLPPPPPPPFFRWPPPPPPFGLPLPPLPFGRPPPPPFGRPPLPPFGRPPPPPFGRPPPPRFGWPPPPPPPFGRPPLQPFGVKDNSKNEKRSEVAHPEGQSNEKFLPGYGLPFLRPPPFIPYRRPFGFSLPPPLPFGFKDNHLKEKERV